MTSAAMESNDGRFRYWLTRGEPGARLCFVMLNPSTADAIDDDPTIRRCIGFRDRWGFSELLVLNLYPHRATKPKDLQRDGLPAETDENARHWAELLPTAGMVVAAWGASARPLDSLRFYDFARFRGVPLYCLGVTASGEPKHPLYLAKTTPPRLWKR